MSPIFVLVMELGIEQWIHTNGLGSHRSYTPTQTKAQPPWTITDIPIEDWLQGMAGPTSGRRPPLPPLLAGNVMVIPGLRRWNHGYRPVVHTLLMDLRCLMTQPTRRGCDHGAVALCFIEPPVYYIFLPLPPGVI
jgi:hypothetical protein